MMRRFLALLAFVVVAPTAAGSELTRCNKFDDAAAAWTAVASGAEEPMPLCPLSPTVLLPDGSAFRTWEQSAEHRRTFFVAGAQGDASDDNPGTEEQPWKTIGRAAACLEPGDRVLVKEGLYREWVRPARGGTGPRRMITYEAAPNQRVVISGAEPFAGPWRVSSANSGSDAAFQVWTAELPDSLFPDGNPFAKANLHPSMLDGPYANQKWATDPPHTLAQGLIFQDGRRLTQVATSGDLAQLDGTYWVEPGGRRLHVRPFGDSNPADVAFEITARPFAFAPEAPGLGFIRVKGFTVQHVANCYPVPQRGAISALQGHHWIVEDNVVQQVSALGLDYGRRQTFIPFEVPEDTPALAGVGHIVRRNTFRECGVCSLSGLGLIGGLVEANYSQGCGWQRCSSIHECAGIKLHYLKHSLARRNVVVDPVDASGLWIDHSNANSRATENIILGGNGAAGIFFEASYRANLVDHNIVWGFDGNAIIIQHTSRLTVVNNLFGACKKKPVQFNNSRTRPRILDLETQRPAMGMGNLVASNIFYGFGNVGPNLPDGNYSDGNLFVNPPDAEPFNLDTWRQTTWQEKNSMACVASMAFSRDDWTLRQEPLLPVLPCPRVFEVSRDFFGAARPPEVNTEAGPFLQVNMKREIRLVPK